MGRTFLQQKQEVARQVRMNLENTDQESAIEYWLNEGQDMIERKHNWWFVSATYALTLSVVSRQYAFPATDIDGNARELSKIDTKSMRTVSKPLWWSFPNQLDRDFENWANTTDTGSPTHWTVEGYNVSLNRIPSQAWIDTHVKVMFRGYSHFPALTVDTDESIVPNNWRNLLELYASSKGHARQGDESNEARKMNEFEMGLERMVAECVPVLGAVRNTKAPTIFNLPSRRVGRAASVRR